MSTFLATDLGKTLNRDMIVDDFAYIVLKLIPHKSSDTVWNLRDCPECAQTACLAGTVGRMR